MIIKKPMLPSFVEQAPIGEEWVYEAKYDGFRALFHIDENEAMLISRNGKKLNHSFPEVIEQVQIFSEKLKRFLPLIADGELAVLSLPYHADFKSIQIRGRTSTTEKILKLTNELPVHFLLFDMIHFQGENISNMPFFQRKKVLYDFCNDLNIPDPSNYNLQTNWLFVPYHENKQQLWDKILDENGEGIIAKKKNSQWIEGKRTQDWLKIKNFKYDVFVVLAYEKQNGFFHVGLLHDQTLISVGLFVNGIESEEKNALITIMEKNKVNEDETFIKTKPAICVELRFIEWYDKQIRHPQFVRFRFDKSWEQCTTEQSEYTRMHFYK